RRQSSPPAPSATTPSSVRTSPPSGFPTCASTSNAGGLRRLVSGDEGIDVGGNGVEELDSGTVARTLRRNLERRPRDGRAKADITPVISEADPDSLIRLEQR